MILLSSSEDRTFDELDDLLRFINEHAESEDYAIVFKRIKKFKLDIKCKVWIICDRERKSHECTRQNRRHDDSRHIECLFSIIVKLVDENSDSWIFEVKNSQHNHAFIIVDAHSVLRRMTMTREIRNEIFTQMIVQITSREILFNLRLSHAALPHAANEKANFDLINSDINLMIRSRDIYNIRAQLRRDDLRFMTSIQALMHQLSDEDWFFVFQKNRRNQITHLFFSKKSSQFMLKTNYEVLVMNCTYKINRYKMPLFIISDQTALHKNFYVAFCFMSKKKQNDYMWILQQLRSLYAKMEIPDSTVLLTDMKKSKFKFLIQRFYSSTCMKKRSYECLSLDFSWIKSFVVSLTHQQQCFDQLQKAFHHQRSMKHILFSVKRCCVCVVWAWVSRTVK